MFSRISTVLGFSAASVMLACAWSEYCATSASRVESSRPDPGRSTLEIRSPIVTAIAVVLM